MAQKAKNSQNNHKSYLGKRQCASVYLHPCDNYEIIAAIDKLDPNKSSEYIDIPIILIKQSKFINADAIRRAFNYSIENGI